MPPEIKTNRSTMVDGAIAIIEESGFVALSARTLAEKLGISTQPIYREFGDMDGVRKATVERGWQLFAEYVKGEAEMQAVRYVTFAAEHKNLFGFLFRNRNCEYSGLNDMSHKLVEGTEIIDKLSSITGLNREKVYRLHLVLWMALHGLASMCADNDVKISDKEIRDLTVETTRALSAFYKKEGKKV